MALSSFTDKSHEPSGQDLHHLLGNAHESWTRLIAAVSEHIGPLSPVWAYASKNTGWGLRLRHKERIILYMTPQAGQFLVSFALGEKAVTAARKLKLPASVLATIDAAPRYAEGRGVRFVVSKGSQVAALVKLAKVKKDTV